MHLITINLRYFVFRDSQSYYLLDRKPRHFICYFFFPLSWLFKQKIYRITEEEYLQLIERVNQPKSGIVIPTSLTGGTAVLLSVLLRRSGIIDKLNTGFSRYTTVLFIFLLLVLAQGYVQLIHYTSKKNLSAFFPLQSRNWCYAKLSPSSFTSIIAKRIFAHVMLWLLTLITGVIALESSNLFFLLSTFLMLSLMFSISIVGHTSDIRYHLTKI